MSKLFRGFIVAGVVTMILAAAQLAFAGGMITQSKERDPETTKNTGTSKKSKKKKKRAASVPILLVVGTPTRPATVAEPIPAPPVVTAPAPEVVQVAPQPAARGVVRSSSTTGLFVAPIPEPLTATPGQLVISEFRLFGLNGSTDEFIEIFNNSGADHTVDASGSGTGYAIAASDGVVRCTIPDGTVIPNKGHYLCANAEGYSLTPYPAGNGTTATPDATFGADIPTNAGIALFTTNVPAEFSLATRLDAVGSTSEANTLYKEGTGYPDLTEFPIDQSFYRDNCGKSGSITTFGPCPTAGSVKDTNDNATDFIYVDTNATFAGAGQRLGAPGPENLSSPIERNASVAAALLDPCVAAASTPNRVRDFTEDIVNHSALGTLDVRRTITNNTGANVTRLRFRVVDMTTFPAPSGIADLRVRSSGDLVVVLDRPPCGTGTSTTLVRGTTLEQSDTAPPVQQPHGGGFNSTLGVGVITLATPLGPGQSIDVRFLLGVQEAGSFRFFVNIEALP